MIVLFWTIACEQRGYMEAMNWFHLITFQCIRWDYSS